MCINRRSEDIVGGLRKLNYRISTPTGSSAKQAEASAREEAGDGTPQPPENKGGAAVAGSAKARLRREIYEELYATAEAALGVRESGGSFHFGVHSTVSRPAGTSALYAWDQSDCSELGHWDLPAIRPDAPFAASVATGGLAPEDLVLVYQRLCRLALPESRAGEQLLDGDRTRPRTHRRLGASEQHQTEHCAAGGAKPHTLV